MKLTDAKIRGSNPGKNPRKLTDGESLFLLIHPNGSKYWQFAYRFGGKERKLSIGKYPLVSLAEARLARSAAQKLLAQNIDPSGNKQKERLLAEYRDRNSFLAVAEEWRECNSPKWDEKHNVKLWGRLQNHVFPYLAKRPVSDISPLEILAIIHRIERKGLTTMSRRVLQICSAIFRYAKITGRISMNPATDLSEALKPHKVTHYPTLQASSLPAFIRALDVLEATDQNKIAFLLLLHTAVRTGELRHAKWEHFDLDRGEWHIPAKFMKMRRDHFVPLSRQALELLAILKPLTGDGEWLFPSRQRRTNQVMSDATILRMIKRMGYHGKVVGHGFRSMFSTFMNEAGFNPDAIERQLAHAETNGVRAAYNRAEYIDERFKLMQFWSDHLEKCHLSTILRTNLTKSRIPSKRSSDEHSHSNLKMQAEVSIH